MRSGDAKPQFAGVVDGSGARKSGGDAAVLRRRVAIYDRAGEAKLADLAARGSGVVWSLLLSTWRDTGLCKRALGNRAVGKRGVPVGGDGAVEVPAIEARTRSAIARGRIFIDEHTWIGSSSVAATPVFFVEGGI